MTTQQIPILIFLIPFVTCLIIPLFWNNRLISQALAAVAVLMAALYSLFGLLQVRDGSYINYHLSGWIPPFGIEWHLDSLSALMALLVNLVAFVVLVSTGQTVDKDIGKDPRRTAYYMVVLLHISGLLGMILTHDFFNLFVFLEVASLTAYALIGSGHQLKSTVSSFRYLLIGTIGASFYLLGVGYLYVATGTLNMTDLTMRLPEVMASRTVFLGALLMLLGLAIKMGLFPFHGWLPDAYTYAPDSATAFIAPIMTKVAIYTAIRIFYLVLGAPFLQYFGLSQILLILGTFAVIAGSVMAFVQKEFKRMLAYSSVSHIGLIILALGLNHPAAFMGAVLHVIHHAVMKTILFLIAASAYYKHGVHNIFDFAKLREKMPFTMAAFAVTALSMIGVPPMCGFFSKWYILVGSLQSGYPGVAVVVVGASLLTALYFFRVIEQAFYHKTPAPEAAVAEGPIPAVVASGLLSLVLLILGFYAPSIFAWGMRIMAPGSAL